MATRKKGAQSAKPSPEKTRPEKHSPEKFCDAVYWQMFRVESGRPDAKLCLAATLLRAWLALEKLPARSEPRQWLRQVSPVCVEMLESVRAGRRAGEPGWCGDGQGSGPEQG